MKKLSIITVCLDEATTIEHTLKSVANQKFTDFEFIVIDGGSTDGTLDIINNYHDQIDVLISEQDTGIYNAMNKGIKAAKGEYVSFLNAGDYYCNSLVLVNAFQSTDGEDIIYGDIVAELSNGTHIRKEIPGKLGKLYMTFDTIPHPGTLIKKNLFEDLGLYNENFRIASDYEFFLKAIFSHNCSYKYIPIPFAVFNLMGVSQTKKGRKLGLQERKAIHREHFSKSYMSSIWMKSILYNFLIKYPSFGWFYLKGRVFPKSLKDVSK